MTWPWNELHRNPNARRRAWNLVVGRRIPALCKHGPWHVYPLAGGTELSVCLCCGRETVE